jgi:hypothetical protein
VKRRLIASAVLSAVAATVALAPSAHAVPAPDQRQLIPLYVYPDWWNATNDWTSACTGADPTGDGSTVIAPVTGAGAGDNADFAHAIALCHAANQNVIGYVDTGYGTVPLATAEANVNHWYAYYDGTTTVDGFDDHIDGIFVDEMANFPAEAASGWPGHTIGEYYRALYTYIKNHDRTGTFDDVVGNPGAAAPTDWQLNDAGTPTQAADEVVVFEGSAADYATFSAPAWLARYPADAIAGLVYDVPAASVAATCAALKTQGFGRVDVTDATITATATPWNSLPDPAYFAAMVAACS